MNIAASVFEKHGYASFDVWLSEGKTMCAAFKERKGIAVVLIQKERWKEWERKEPKENLLFCEQHLRVHDVRIVKSGWFATATVDFDADGPFGRSAIQGKTDKGFAEFLVSICHQITHD